MQKIKKPQQKKIKSVAHRRGLVQRLEKIATVSTPIAADSTETPRPEGDHEGQTDQRNCPSCGFGARQHDHFCRRCGVNLDQLPGATTGLLSLLAAAETKSKPLVAEQSMGTGSNVSGKVNPTFPKTTG